jgi:hypothetical protein
MREYNAKAFETLETFEETVEINGTKQPVKIEDLKTPDLNTLQQYHRSLAQIINGGDVDDSSLPSFTFEPEDSERDYMALLIEHKLLKPDIDPDKLSASVARKIMGVMVDCWMDTEGIEKVRDEIATEGNG